MKILRHFKINQHEYDIDCCIYNLNNKERRTFLSKLPNSFRRSYVSDIKLNKQISKLDLKKEEIISEYIPDPGSTMAGEFGEIISYLLIKERYLPLQ